jgi:hypothetical protein
MLKALLLLVGAGSAYGIYKSRGPKEFAYSIVNLDWVNRRFDFDFTMDGKTQSSQQGVGMNTATNGSSNKMLVTNVFVDQAKSTVTLEAFYQGKKVAGKIVDFKNRIVSTLTSAK